MISVTRGLADRLSRLKLRTPRLLRRWKAVATSLLVAGALPAMAEAQTCNGEFYLAQNATGSPLNFQRFNTSSNPFTYQTLSTTTTLHNALSYHPPSGKLYAMSNSGTNLLRLSATGTIEATKSVTNLPSGFYNTGEINPGNGLMFVKIQNSSKMYRFDPSLATPVATEINLSRTVGTADMAWHDGYLWSIETNGQLVRISTTGTVTNIGSPSGSRTFGAMFGASNGVYASANNGGFYKVDTATGQLTLISDSPGASNNDGARCASAPVTFPSDLAVTKTDLKDFYFAGEAVTYRIVVSNNGPFGASNALVNDAIPTGVTSMTWTCATGSAGGACGSASGTGAITNARVNLPANASVVFNVTARVDANYTGILSNTVTVTAPDDAPDANPSNNTATDINGTVVLSKQLTNENGSVPNVVENDEELTYQLSATNPTTVGVTGFTMVDQLDPNVELIDADSATVDGTTLRWTFDVPAGTTIVRNVRVRAVLRDGVTRINNIVTQPGAPVPTCPSAACVSLPAEPRISLSKELINESGTIAETPEPNEELTYRITVLNRGGAATATPVADKLDANVDYVTSSNSGTYDAVSRLVNWAVDVPAFNGTPGMVQLTVTTRVSASLPLNATVANLVMDPRLPAPDCLTSGPQCLIIPTAPAVIVSKQIVAESGVRSGVAEAGEQLTYELTVHNVGGSSTTFDLRDTPDALLQFISATGSPTSDAQGLLWSGIALTPGAQQSFQVVMQVPASLPTGTTNLTNIAYDASGPQPPCAAPQCVSIPAEGEISIAKALTAESGTLPGLAEAGEELTYTITLSNSGGTVSGYNLVDLLDPSVELVSYDQAALATVTADRITWEGLTIPGYSAGQPGTLALNVTVRLPTDIDGITGVRNVAMREGQTPPTCPNAACVETATREKIAITKALTAESGTIDDVAEPGEQLTYTITLTNTGGTNATGLSITDALDANVTFVSADNGGSVSGGTVVWNNLTVPAQSGATPGTLVLTVVTRVATPLPTGVTSIGNIAYQTGTTPPTCPSDACVDMPTVGNTTVVKALTAESGNVSGVAEAGEQLTYTITLTNTGGADVTGYSITDALDANVSFVSADNAGVFANDEVVWSNLTIPAQSGSTPGTLVLTVVTEVADPLPAGATRIGNVAYQTGTTPPTCPSDACVSTPTEGQVSLAKALTAESGTLSGVAEAGEQLTYTITLTNTGGSAVSGYSVTDALDANVSFVSADNAGVHANGEVVWSNLTIPAQVGSVAGTLTLTVVTEVADPLPAGVTSIGNIAYETGTTAPTCPNAACVSTPTRGNVTLTKALTGESGTVNGVAEPGETLTYTITLTNTGGSAVTGYAVTDAMGADLTFVSASNGGVSSGQLINWTNLTIPAQAGSVAGTLELTVVAQVADPIPAGTATISNIVYQTGTTPPACPNAACVTTPTPGQVTLAKALFSESGTQSGVAEAGEQLTYTITLTNTGGSAVTGYSVTDALDANVSFVSADNAGVHANGEVVWSNLTIPAQVGSVAGTLTLTVVTEVADPLPAGVTGIGNIAYQTGTTPPTCPNASCVSTPTTGLLTLTKALVAESGTLNGVAEAGEQLTYTITLTNTGGSAVTGYSVTDALDASVSFVSANNAGVHANGEVVWSNLTIPAQSGNTPGRLTLTVVTEVADPLPAGVTGIGNIAYQTGTTPPPCPSDACVTTPTAGQVALAKALASESGTLSGVAEAGEQLTYTITLTNTGGSAVSGYSVTDALDANVSFVSADNAGVHANGEVVWSNLTIPAQVGSVAGTLTLTVVTEVVEPLPVGVTSIGNIAYQTGTTPPTCPSDACVTTPTAGEVTLTKALVSESGTQSGLAEAGEDLTYTITLTNTGGSAVSGYSVTDALDANVSFVSADNAGVHANGEVVWSNLTIPAQVGSTPGTVVLTVVTRVADPLPMTVQAIRNIAYETGTPVPTCPSTECVDTPVAEIVGLEAIKTGVFVDLDGNGYPSAGDRLDYTITVRNTGNVVMENVAPVDAGPTFNGQAAAGALGGFTPASATLAVGEEVAFTASYELQAADIEAAAGQLDGVRNVATATGTTPNGGTRFDTPETESLVNLPAIPGGQLTLTKQAGLRHIHRGERAPFLITVSNDGKGPVQGVDVTDILPSGFRYVDGSLTVDGRPHQPTVSGRNVSVDDLIVPPSSRVEIRLEMLALGSVSIGRHANRVVAVGPDGEPLAPEASAFVEILADPVFDCGDLIGKVFVDLNGNGVQDEGEPGLAGVRLATVNGLLVTTDAYGRYHIACAALPRERIGSNFSIKLDERTLPQGHQVSSANPEVVRLTPGKMGRINFAVAPPAVVTLSLEASAFDGATLSAQGRQALAEAVQNAGDKPTLVDSTLPAGSDSDARVSAVRDTLRALWAEAGRQSTLNVQLRAEVE